MPSRKKTAKTKTSRSTVHAFVEQLLARTKKPYAEIAQQARKEFDSETSPASVRHYASKMRRNGQEVKERPVSREAAFT